MTSIDSRVQDLHQQAIIIDGHSDILIPITDNKMSLDERVDVPDPSTWQAPPGLISTIENTFAMPPHVFHFGPMGQYDLPRFRDGGLTAQLCAIYIEEAYLNDPLRRGLKMAWQLQQTTSTLDEFELVTSTAQIHRLKMEGKCGAVLTMEGFEALGGDLAMLDIYYQLGLRSASLTHTRRNRFADGCYAAVQAGGLTSLGKEAVQRMNELGIVIDLVHIHERGFWEIIDLTTAPVILSHSTSTQFPSTRDDAYGLLGNVVPRPNLELPRDREKLEALADNGGVLGIIWIMQVDVDDVVVDIETALEVMGEDHIGLGSDLYGVMLAPLGLEDISKIPVLTRRLVERGHSDEMILKFLGGNYMRVFEQVWRDERV
jgi:membrane dipeptidase